MFLTGMRVGEIGGLKWRILDFKNKCIHIKRSLSCQYYHGEKMLKITTPKLIIHIEKSHSWVR